MSALEFYQKYVVLSLPVILTPDGDAGGVTGVDEDGGADAVARSDADAMPLLGHASALWRGSDGDRILAADYGDVQIAVDHPKENRNRSSEEMELKHFLQECVLQLHTVAHRCSTSSNLSACSCVHCAKLARLYSQVVRRLCRAN
jgi:hypothetical protein